jgi:7-cyano-7-deazaguanine synthase
MVKLPEHTKTALVCFSGGQDSTTCLYWAKKNFRRVEAVIFRYGQRHEIEVEVASKITTSTRLKFFFAQ